MVTIILFAPLVGAILAGFGWKLMGEKGAQWTTTGLLFLAALLSWIVFLTLGDAHTVSLFRFIESGTLSTEWAIRVDRLTSIMLIVVTTVSALVHLYSFGYMAHDPQFEHTPYRARFFAYLSLFTFAMLALVTSDNLVQMFFGWEGVGLASYLLIGFYYKKPSANAAAIKAFVVNRVGDFGFALGIFALFYLTDSIQFDQIFNEIPRLAETQLTFLWTEWNAANLIAFLLFIGAMGKSAQLFLHTWLPDAMEGPTPVSALIHAATMVTAGVFLVCRMSPLMEFAPQATAFITFLGATTAFFAATVGLVQNDIKRVIAYSTCSQLGYMFVAAGVGVYPVAMFHLLTHAFFKAMLFLGAGSVIHAMHHEQDMRNYGGLRKKVPYTFWAMMIGTLAITGVGIPLTGWFGFAGFVSKDAIIESAWAGTQGGYAFWMLVIAALFTSFYSWRLMFLTFYGKPRGDKHTHEHAHESPKVMTIPLGVLAIGAVFSGMVFYSVFFGNHDKVLSFFGMPAHHAEASEEGHGTETAAAEDHGDAAATEESQGEETAAADTATEEVPAADTATEDAGEASAMGGEHGETAAAQHAGADAATGLEYGAIYMAPDNTVMDDAHHAPIWVKLSPFVAMVLGFAVAYWFYIVNPVLPRKLAEQQRPLYLFLLNKWYFDEAYDFLFVRPAKAVGRFFWKRGDGNVIDGSINGVAMGIIPFFTKLAGRAQSGYIFTYAFAMVIGIAILVTWMSILGGAH
ncbi:MAG: NADH-quinone oxidoreductase subunit L [Rhodobacteraceae bacterium]|jgi:NADH-quinone oxidoreductase subunit L|uniref:NADH dehydrogenase subunit L n=1 Tax=Salipiger profundus TaxID=1229727 RepID=A0A1U7DBW9_9RHOB|nr:MULTISPECIES: NADH-quinone oxidoreductase subunit L [Salipiger]APX25566.1 NADH dehydrogenase subunit L [Salipiger profundus]MAB06255.1 NADH-quinone oxidoreductase subunit L [Paracoccaceae bacterium]GGA04631.1 NADH-quinone oxidoreductase subunit L [Salipiger profundus]SFD71110.1 NADH dehydrogenase subunit L [Salipiger profundus]